MLLIAADEPVAELLEPPETVLEALELELELEAGVELLELLLVEALDVSDALFWSLWLAAPALDFCAGSELLLLLFLSSCFFNVSASESFFFSSSLGLLASVLLWFVSFFGAGAVLLLCSF